ncbi:Pectin Methylesterase Inihibitor 7 [Hibiscus trionum]|uniref:Pectin Methylesterase Inihibitor 7 n=1 Tax=Hibiscus trionum TaxID=183268 RepID=A0A9W7HDJ4_HIBTR|nr:Pectin Methylesterase Inihibitor 7 [Hibiscus trionum]
MECLILSKLSFLQFYALQAIVALTLLFSITNPSSAARLVPQSKASNTDYVKTSCEVTMYPDICYQTLSAYASTIQTSPRELANTALSISLNGAQSTSTLVLKLSKEHGLTRGEAVAIADCVETMSDSVDELRQSMAEMKDLKGPEFQMKMSNIQTWVSAALTNEDTCMDGIEAKAVNGKIKDTIRSNIARVAHLTSNALAFINRLSY